MKELLKPVTPDEERASAARVMTGDLTARAKIRQLPGRVTIGVQHMRGMTGTLDVIGRQASRRAAAHDDD